MLKLDDITERKLADRALDLFVSTYGLCWNDSYLAAVLEREQGAELVARVLNVLSTTGCTFGEAIMAVDLADGRAELLVLETAPLGRGRVAA